VPPFLLPIYQAAGVQYDVPWPILAAINWIETDFGRNLSVSTAGAIGWMQFLPSTWAQYGVDATGSGMANPYDPVDAIFAAARYLHAAGASGSLPGAIYAYNHADWYVQSVLLRAKLISGYPAALIDALTELMQARFPVAGRVDGYRHPEGGQRDRVVVSAPRGTAAVAVADGRILRLGHSSRLGRYAVLEDAFGNVYTYAGLGRLARAYPVPHPVTLVLRQIVDELAPARAPAPSAPASSGTVSDQGLPGAPPAVNPAKERLFVYPMRPASYASGGLEQISSGDPRAYFAGTMTLRPGQYRLAPLLPGSTVLAGTVLGRLKPARAGAPSSMTFMINPAGKGSPRIDPEPILRSWELSARAGIYGSEAKNPLIYPGAGNPTVGQLLLMSKPGLEQQVLADRRARIYACGRRDVRSGVVDRRVLAAIEYLSVLGLHPTVTGLVCGQGLAHAGGTSLVISGIDGTPVRGHQGPRSLTAVTIRALLALQGPMRPSEIISLHSYPGQSNTLALPDHADRIEVAFGSPSSGRLDAGSWSRLAAQLAGLPEPTVISPSGQRR
jgi:hypothetical protein